MGPLSLRLPWITPNPPLRAPLPCKRNALQVALPDQALEGAGPKVAGTDGSGERLPFLCPAVYQASACASKCCDTPVGCVGAVRVTLSLAGSIYGPDARNRSSCLGCIHIWVLGPLGSHLRASHQNGSELFEVVRAREPASVALQGSSYESARSKHPQRVQAAEYGIS